MTTKIKPYQSEMKDNFVIYQMESSKNIAVYVAEDTVWLTQAQIAELFSTTPQNVTTHIRNIFKENELKKNATCKEFLQVQQEGNRQVNRQKLFYNLDMILSIGYRVKSLYATRFRIWATSVLRDYLLTGAILYHRLTQIEKTLQDHDDQIKSLIQKALPSKQGVFYNGQIFDAYQFVSDLIRSAKESILLIDNYADDSVLTQLTKRTAGVSVIIGVSHLTEAFKLDIVRHNKQYPPVQVREIPAVHDRFLLLDGSQLYTFGASFKDLGKKLFCFTKIESTEVIKVVRKLVAD